LVLCNYSVGINNEIASSFLKGLCCYLIAVSITDLRAENISVPPFDRKSPLIFGLTFSSR